MNPDIRKRSLEKLKQLFLAADQTAYAQMALTLIRQGKDVKGALWADPLGDDWMDFHSRCLMAHRQHASGHVYLALGEFPAKLVKVGKTKDDPRARLKTLDTAAALVPLALVGSLQVHDRHWVEAETHRRLRSSRVPSLKEFFLAAPENILLVLKQAHFDDITLLRSQGMPEAATC